MTDYRTSKAMQRLSEKGRVQQFVARTDGRKKQRRRVARAKWVSEIDRECG